MEVGIKRRPTNGERVSRLNRKCRVIYRLCIMRKVTMLDTASEWSLADWAQIVTQGINCEQPQGPPALAALSHTKCPIDRVIDVTAKGKNLESRSEHPNVVVMFSHKTSSWSARAKVYHKVTTPLSLGFEVPQFRPLTDNERRKENLTEIIVGVTVTVDDRKADDFVEFAYVLPKRQRTAAKNVSPPDMTPEEVFSVIQSGELNQSMEVRNGVTFQAGDMAQRRSNQASSMMDRRTSDTSRPQRSMPNQLISMNAQVPVAAVQQNHMQNQQMPVTNGRPFDTGGPQHHVPNQHMSTNTQVPDTQVPVQSCHMPNQNMSMIARVPENVVQQGYPTTQQLPGYTYPSQNKIKTEAQNIEDSISWSVGQPPGQVTVPMETEDRHAAMAPWTHDPSLSGNYVTIMDDNISHLHIDDRRQGQGQGWHNNPSL